MTKLQTALLEQGLLEKVKEQFQYGFVYEIYPDELQRLYIHKNCGCKRQLHNLFVKELYDYLEGIGFQKGQIPDEFIKNLSSTKSYKAKFQYMKEVDSLALSAARLDFVGSIRKYNSEFVPKGNKYKKKALKQVETIGKELTFRDLKGMPKFSAKYFSEQSFTTNNQKGSVRLEEYPGVNKRYMALTIPKLKNPIKLRYHRELPEDAKITKVVIHRVGQDRYTASISVTFTKEHLVLKHDTESLDKLKTFLHSHPEYALGLDYAQQEGCVPSTKDKTLLDGILATFQKTYRKNEKKLKALQRQLSKKIKQSNAYLKLRSKIKKLHKKITNIRKNALNVLSYRLAKQFAMVSVEDIDLRGMSQTLKLAKNLLDNGFGIFRQMLEYKLKANGYFFVKIGRFEKSTQTCHECGYVNKVTKNLKVKEYDCGGCGRHLYRDYNAALNIRDIGIRDISAEHFQKKQAKFSLADLRARKKRAGNLS